MFDDYESEVCGFSSSWRTEKTTAEGGCQTTEYSTNETGTVTAESHNAQIQTDPVGLKLLARPSTPPGLAQWLQGIAPMVMAELQSNETSNAFKGYDPYADENDRDVKAIILQSFHAGSQPKDAVTPSQQRTSEKVPISSLSWSSAGNTLAVASGFLYHDVWCQHDGNLSVYIRKGRIDDLKLSGELKHSSCVSSVAFHPTEPALLASGTVAGMVSVWNLQHYTGEDSHSQSLLGCDSSAHSSRKISGLLWMTAEQIFKYLSRTSRIQASDQVLVTSGSTIITWLINITASTMVQQNCYELYGSSIGRAAPSPEITCVDFIRYWNSEKGPATEDLVTSKNREMTDDLFAVGCITGEIIVCRMTTAKPIATSSNTDPCVGNLEPHMASVLCIAFSSLHSRVLLTLAADQQIRLYDILQDEPLRVIFPEHQLSRVQWVPGNELLILGAAAERSEKNLSSSLKVLSIASREEVPIEGLDVIHTPLPSEASNLSPCGITSMCFDTKSLSKIAIGDMQGNVRIWNIPFQNIVIPDQLFTTDNNALSNILYSTTTQQLL